MADNLFLQSPLDKLIEESKSYELPRVEVSRSTTQDDAAPARTMRKNGLMPPQNLQPIFEEASAEFGVPLNVLAALGQQESGYNHTAVGTPTKWGRAKGLMQYIDPTANSLGINPFDPQQAVRAAAAQLRDRLDQGYSIEEAIAAHHGGDDRRQWGPKTARYVDDVMGKAGAIGQGFMKAAKAQSFDPAGIQAELDAKDPGRFKVLMPEEADRYQKRADLMQGSGQLKAAQDALKQPTPSPLVPGSQLQSSAPSPLTVENQKRVEAGIPPKDTRPYQGFVEATGNALANVPEHFQQSIAGLIQMAGEDMGQERERFIADRARQYGITPGDMKLLAWAGNQKLIDPKMPIPEALSSVKQNIAKSLNDEQLKQLSAAGIVNPDEITNYAKQWRADTQKTMAEVRPEPGSAAYYGSAAIGSLAEMAPMIAGAIITRSPKVAMSIMGGQVGGQAYAEGREKGLTPDQAKTYSLLYAAAEAAPEALVVGHLLKPGAGVMKKVLEGTVMEGAQEGITEALQAGIDKGMIDPNMTMKDALVRIRDAMIIGALSGGPMAGGIAGAEALGRRPQQEASAQGAQPAAQEAQPATQKPEAPQETATPQSQSQQAPEAATQEQVAPATVQPDSAAQPAQTAEPAQPPSGPLTRSAEKAVQKSGESVTVQSQDGAISGTLDSYVDHGNGNWSAKVTAEDGNTYDFTHDDGVNIVRQQAPSIEQTEQSESPDIAPAAPEVQAAAPEIVERQDQLPAATEMIEQPAEAPAPVEQPAARDYSAMTEPELRAELKAVSQQLKQDRTNAALKAQRREIERVINALKANGNEPAGTETAPEHASAAASKPIVERTSGSLRLNDRERTFSFFVIDPEEDTSKVQFAEPGEVGRVVGSVRGNQLRISTAVVSDHVQGKGVGTKAYAQLADEAFKRGMELASDVEVTEPAARVYEKLSGMGYSVERNPAARLEDVDGVRKWVAKTPVFVVRQAASQQPETEQEGPQPGQQVTLGKGRQAGTVVDVTPKGVKVQMGTRVEQMSLAQFNKRLSAAEQDMDAPAPVMDAPVNTEQTAAQDGWRDNLMKARKYANEIGVPHKGKSLEKLVAEIDGYLAAEQREKVEPPPAQAKPAGYGASNKLVTADRAAELRARLKSKLNGSQLNSGIDPEILALGAELAVFHIEAGVRKFADFASTMAADLDMPIERVRPYLRGWFNGARDMIEDAGLSIEGMDGPDEVRAALRQLDAGEPAAEQRGKRETVATPAGREFEVQHKVVEADSLVTSNDASGAINPQYPQELQPRDRSRSASQDQINDIASRLNPRLLGDSASATDGAPIVSADGVVESGNGRTLAIRQAYARGLDSAKRYREWLAGQGYNVNGMRQPVLVRERVTPMTMDERRAYTAEANDRTTLEMSSTERAMADARKLGPILNLHMGGDLAAAANRDFVRAFVGEVAAKADRGRILDADGQLSQDGRRRIEAALLASAYGDEALITDLFESADTDIKAIGGALLDVSGGWAKMREAARDGVVSRSSDMTPNLLEAVNLIRRARAEGRPVAELARQNDIFEGELDPATIGFLSVFYRGESFSRARGREKVADALRHYTEQALQSQPGTNMFGDPEVSGAEILRGTNDRIQRQEQQAGQQQDIFASPRAAGEDAGAPGRDGQGPQPEAPGQSPAQGGLNVPGSAERVERDRQDAGAAQPVVPAADGNARGEDAEGSGRAGEGVDGQQGAGQRDQRVPGDRAAAGGKRGDQLVHRADGQFEPSVGAAGNTERAGSGVDSLQGQILEQERAAAVVEDAAAPGADDLDQRLAAQRKAQNAPTKWGDKASIDAALPLLLPEQRDDVLKAEQRLAKHNGILYTNGTGTGKTASGLGVAKRHINAGKDSVLVVVPSDKIAADWVKFAGMLGIELKQLKDTTDSGKSGPVVTTYANFGQNQSLAQRDWDLLIADESHYLSSNENGDGTAALEQLRALTGHHAGFYAWVRQRHAKEWQAYAAAMKARGDANGNLDIPMERYAELEAAEAKAREKWEAIEKPAREKWDERWAKQEGLPKTVLLSATPFAYAKNTDYAEGYLFHYVDPANLKKSEGNVGGYNSGSARDQFMMQHFGYRMRYNKLTAPEAGVNSQLMEQQFNEWLKSTGALSGRRLEVPFDYDRKFVLVDDAVGTKIDEGLKYLREAEEGKYREVYEAVIKQFDYQRRMYLLESMKARASVPIIREHLDIGRKVVVFHDYNQGGGFNPFSEAIRSIIDHDVKTLARSVLSKPMFKIDFAGLFSPIETLTEAFPEALLFNGTVSKGQRRKNADLFNDDDSGRNLIVVQSDAGREGVSLHDTTGKHQRVLLNLGMPVKPVAATQIEGRTYRTGQASDAVFRYLTTGTAWEASAFASKIAERASTAENLALGSEARGLKEAFIEAYQNADAFPASADDGKGGKDYDRKLSASLTTNPFERAKTFYWAQQKNTKRRDQREGADYFATPEPVGFKMVEWAGIQPNDKVLEPSAGHGAIARFLPEQADVTIVEPSYELSQRAALVNGNARIVNDIFEQLHITNKYDAIVMNPPYGSGGKTSTEHLAKAAKHLRDGGRIVALLPRGGMADKRLDAFLESEEASDLFTVARIDMPAATFERAGTSVNTQVIVLEKHANPADAEGILQRNFDLSNAESVNELFDRIERLELPPRRPSSTPAPKEEIVEHTTTKGKLLKGVIRTDLTQDEAKEIDPYTFRKKNAAGETGWFLRLKNLGDAAPRYSVQDGVVHAEFGPVTESSSVADAVDQLMAAQTGEAIIKKDGVGEISLVYGNGNMGLAHIAKRRGESFMQRLPELIENGNVYTKPDQPGRIFIGNDTAEAVVRLDWNGEAKTWLVSAYERYRGLQPGEVAQEVRRSQVVAERSQEAPANSAEVRRAITRGPLGELVSRMIDKGMIVIHDDSSTLPSDAGRGKRGVQAVTTSDNVIHLVAGNLTPSNANAVLLHEEFHSGVERLVGSKRWGELQGRLASLYRQAQQSTGKAGELHRRAVDRVSSAKAQGAVATRMEVEEFGAYLIEEYSRAPESLPAAFRKWVQDIIGAVKAWMFSRYGKQIGDLTPAQLSALAKDALLVQGLARRGELFGPVAEWFSVQDDSGPQFSMKPSKVFTDLNQEQKDFLDKIAPERLPQRLKDRMQQLTDNLGLRMRQAGVDRYAALLRNDQALHGEDTLEGSIASSSWVLARMSHSAGGAVSALLNNGRIYLDPNEKVIDIREGTEGLASTLRQLGSPAEIDRFMGWIAANRAKRLMEEGRENLFTAQEIEAGMKLSGGKLENGKSRSILYAKAWKEFQQHRDDVLGVAEQSGIITPEQRHTWSDEFYVPFYRVIDEENIGGPSSTSGLSRQQAYKKLKGGSQKLNDLLDNTLLNFHHLLQASLKNQAAVQAVRNAEQLGIAEKTTEAKRDKKMSTFVMEGGEKQWYDISDGLTFKAVSALSNAGLNTPLMKMGRAFKRFFTNMTTITPQFVVANALRDSLSAMATSPTSAIPFKTAISGALTYGNDHNRARMMASGGAFSFGHVYGQNADELKVSLTGTMRNAHLLRDPMLIPNVLLGAWRKYHDITDFAENVNRAGIWKENLPKGKLKAAFEARDLMDFSAHGDSMIMRIMTDLVPFLNARVQGLDKLYRSGVKPGAMTIIGKGTKADKLAFARFGAVVGALTLASTLLFLKNWDDDEYRKLEDWQRDTYWVIRIGSEMYFIPKPFEVGSIATMGERLAEQFLDPSVGGEKFASRLGHMLTDTFAFNPIPQMIKPLYELGANEDTFTGRPIEDQSMSRLSPSLRSRPDTSRLAEGASRGMEEALGLAGGQDMALSPVQIDHMIKGYTGAVGATAVALADTLWRRAHGEQMPARHWYEYQPIKRFYRNLTDEAGYTRYGTDFYEALKKADRAYADITHLQKYGEAEQAADLAGKKADDLAVRKALNTVSRDLAKLNAEMKRVQMDKTKSGEDKRMELDRLRSLRNLMTERVGKALEQEKIRKRAAE